jgi:hypothetical protein
MRFAFGGIETMQLVHGKATILGCISTALMIAVACGLAPGTARAMGTVTIRQADGETNTYHDVKIKVLHGALYMTSADGQGTLVINRAACSYQGQLMVCFATSATLVQAGRARPLDFETGTLYLNTTDDPAPLALSSAKVPAHGILLSFSTKRGTYVNLSGRIDKVVQ